MDKNEKLNELSRRLEILLNRQEEFIAEIHRLKSEIELLKSPEDYSTEESSIFEAVSAPETDTTHKGFPEGKHASGVSKYNYNPPIQKESKVGKKINIEKFIGENLINKIGIIILVIGVGIGAKFAIEHSLVSPVIRIIGGYIVGLVLLVLAIRLKKPYHNYSAVLLSGSMAIFYFMSFSAYSFYSLIPQGVTFALLVVFTVFTVFASINYNLQVIAHIGLVGAYAVPFLLGGEPANYTVLFIYTAVINAGIFAVAIKRYWKPLYLSAFVITWVIYLVWYIGDYEKSADFAFALSFLGIFFALFLGTFLAYKLIKKGKFEPLDVILLTLNSFIFYGIGFSLFANKFDNYEYLGLFTLLTAVVHFIITAWIYTLKLADKNLFYLLAGLVLVFLTIVFPVQFDGNKVTLFWAGEAVVLFLIGRKGGVKFYGYLSYPVILLVFFSLLQDWSKYYNAHYSSDHVPAFHIFFNICFLTSVLVILSYSAISYFMQAENGQMLPGKKDEWRAMMKVVVPVLLIFVAYFSFELEIKTFWEIKIKASGMTIPPDTNKSFSYTQTNDALKFFKSIWILNYTLLYASVVSVLLISFKSSRVFLWISMGVSLLILLFFLTNGLYNLSELRRYYLENIQGEYFTRDKFFIIIRYITYLFAAVMMISVLRLNGATGNKMHRAVEVLVAGTLLWVLTSELLNWLDIAQSKNIYKLALSLFWGIYALSLVVYGIWKQKSHIRIAAFALLGVTLVKLFFYDLSEMKPISRAVLFMVLGVVMLGVSFLYNKYKNVIFDDKTEV